MIVGAWPFDTPAETRVRESEPLVTALSGMEFILKAAARSSIVKVVCCDPRAASQAHFRLRKALASSPGTKMWASLERDPAMAARRHHLRQCGERLAAGWKVEVATQYDSAEILVWDVPVLRMAGDGSVATTEHWPAVMAGARWATAHLPHRL